LRKVILTILILALLTTPIGCKDGAATQSPSGSRQSMAPELPDTAAKPNTIKIDDIFSMVNNIVGYEEDYEFRREYAELWDEVAADDEDSVLYYMECPGYEAVFLVGRETDCLLQCYFRLLEHVDAVYFLMGQAASAFLEVLEPSEHEGMFREAMRDYQMGVEDETETFAYGEIWTIFVRNEDVISLYPS